MAALGNVGSTRLLGIQSIARHILTLPVQPTGNGPIQAPSGFFGAANSTVNLNGLRGAQMGRRAGRFNPSGQWAFYDLSPGTYFATEAGVSRQWQIVVAGDLTFTVTPVTSSFPRTRAYASA